MRNLSIIILAIFLSLNLSAQDTPPEEKMYILGGSFDFNHFNRDENRFDRTLLSISPYFGKQIKPNLIVGLSLNFSYRENHIRPVGDEPTIIDLQNYIYGIGIFSRHIFNPENKLNFFLQPGLNYSIGKTTNNLAKSRSINAGVRAGLQYNINNSLRALIQIGGIGYNSGRLEFEESGNIERYSSFYTELNLGSLSFGLEMKF